MNKEARLEIRLDVGVKRDFLSFCKEHSQTPSEILRTHISNIILGGGNMNGSYKNK